MRLNTRRLAKRYQSGAEIVAQRHQGKLITGEGVQVNVKEFRPPAMQYPPYPPYPSYPPYPQQLAGESGEGMTTVPAKIVGIVIPKDAISVGSPQYAEEEKEKIMGVNIEYALKMRSAKEEEKIFAYAKILWNNKENQLTYRVLEPEISEVDKEIVKMIKHDLEERLDIDFNKIGEIRAKQMLRHEIQLSLQEIEFMTQERASVIVYYLERDILGMGKIQPLMNDSQIEDISCDGIGIPLYIYHRDPRVGSIKTNIHFDDEDELNTFVVHLAQAANKSISVAAPLLDAALPDGSRIQATLGTDIARKGSNFTIRKFTEMPLTPSHLIAYNTIDPLQMAFLWLAVENGKSILVSGGTATGKTSLLNALSLFIRPGYKVVSIEDTAELRLPLPHWIPHVARSALSLKGSVGEITLFDLLRSSLRQRPDYIIVGEVRGKEAFVLFQQIATGHPSMATIHAASTEQLMDRLTTPPISLPSSLIENLDLIIFLTQSRLKGAHVRRSNEIVEVVGLREGKPVTNKVFAWQSTGDTFKIVGQSVILKKLALHLGIDEKAVIEELMRRKRVLEWLHQKNVYDYREFSRAISVYYSDPNRVVKIVDRELKE
ncbi:MAG: type II/IV secretion system ATPase subunit [Nanoarchaeota archaeon]|nr:type II/IV secretion system ATPase subunit [Nanoarchaeota archaeon]